MEATSSLRRPCDAPTLAAWLATYGLPDFEAEPGLPGALALLDFAMVVTGEELDHIGALYEDEARRVCAALVAISKSLDTFGHLPRDTGAFLHAAHVGGRLERCTTPAGIAAEVKLWAETQPRPALPGASPPALDEAARLRRILRERGLTTEFIPVISALATLMFERPVVTLDTLAGGEAEALGKAIVGTGDYLARRGRTHEAAAPALVWALGAGRLGDFFAGGEAAARVLNDFLAACPAPSSTDLFAAEKRRHQDPA